jgi:hypothetical protein
VHAADAALREALRRAREAGRRLALLDILYVKAMHAIRHQRERVGDAPEEALLLALVTLPLR